MIAIGLRNFRVGDLSPRCARRDATGVAQVPPMYIWRCCKIVRRFTPSTPRQVILMLTNRHSSYRPLCALITENRTGRGYHPHEADGRTTFSLLLEYYTLALLCAFKSFTRFPSGPVRGEPTHRGWSNQRVRAPVAATEDKYAVAWRKGLYWTAGCVLRFKVRVGEGGTHQARLASSRQIGPRYQLASPLVDHACPLCLAACVTGCVSRTSSVCPQSQSFPSFPVPVSPRAHRRRARPSSFALSRCGMVVLTAH
jgi:hypothetical protein